MEGTNSNQTIEAVNASLHEDGVTDGLPVVPPTAEAIDEMCRGSDRDPDTVLATLGEDDEPLTIRTLATNAVMAGCSPIHLPVLIAGAEAMGEQSARMDDAATDPGSWAYQWILNGPVRNAIDVRSDTGAFGPGFMANRTIGRALGLAFQNTTRANLRDESVTGTPFKYSLVAGENEEKSPWEPYHIDAGFDREMSTITLSPRRSFIQFIPYGMDATGILEAMQYNTIPDMLGSSHENGNDTIVHTVAPYNAEELDLAGFSKSDVKEYLAENSVRPWDEIGPTLERRHGAFDRECDAAPLQAAQIDDPDQVQIYVVGGSGRFNAVGHAIGGPVTKPIEFPDHWEELLEEYRVERDWGEITEAYDERSDR